MRVLVCPLDWGLGHATRCIPVIRALTRAGHEVIIGAAGGGRRLLAAEFPELEVFDFPGYPIRYSRRAATFLPVLLAQLPGLLLGMLRERSRLDAIVADRRVECVISDGRYGVRSGRIPSIFITHQLFIRAPGNLPVASLAERALLALNFRFLRGFREVWIPDVSGEPNLSGELSHKSPPLPRAVFIGPLSRFQPIDRPWREGPGEAASAPRVDVLASVSGPEPQRARFEAVLRRILEGMSGTRVLVRGLPGDGREGAPGKPAVAPDVLNVFDHLDGETLGALFSSAALVVARSGYTTVMEIASLGLSQVVLVPTPGQSEQEYLADHLDRSGIAMRMEQDRLDLVEAQRRFGRYSGFAAWRGGPSADGLPALYDFIAGHPLLGSGPRRVLGSAAG